MIEGFDFLVLEGGIYRILAVKTAYIYRLDVKSTLIQEHL